MGLDYLNILGDIKVQVLSKRELSFIGIRDGLSLVFTSFKGCQSVSDKHGIVAEALVSRKIFTIDFEHPVVLVLVQLTPNLVRQDHHILCLVNTNELLGAKYLPVDLVLF